MGAHTAYYIMCVSVRMCFCVGAQDWNHITSTCSHPLRSTHNAQHTLIASHLAEAHAHTVDIRQSTSAACRGTCDNVPLFHCTTIWHAHNNVICSSRLWWNVNKPTENLACIHIAAAVSSDYLLTLPFLLHPFMPVLANLGSCVQLEQWALAMHSIEYSIYYHDMLTGRPMYTPKVP